MRVVIVLSIMIKINCLNYMILDGRGIETGQQFNIYQYIIYNIVVHELKLKCLCAF